MAEVTFEAIAAHARRAGVLVALRARAPTMTLPRLRTLLSGPYAADVAQASLGEVLTTTDEVDAKILGYLRGFPPGTWLGSGQVQRDLHLNRWTAQAKLGQLAERGLLERKGRTSGTRYRLRGAL